MTPVKRHFVNIKRPDGQLDSRGQVKGSALTVASDVPCSIEVLTGRELEHAKMVVANASQRVRFYDSPEWNLTTKDWLEFGQRRLNIGSIRREDEIQLEVELLCAEAV